MNTLVSSIRERIWEVAAGRTSFHAVSYSTACLCSASRTVLSGLSHNLLPTHSIFPWVFVVLQQPRDLQTLRSLGKTGVNRILFKTQAILDMIETIQAVH